LRTLFRPFRMLGRRKALCYSRTVATVTTTESDEKLGQRKDPITELKRVALVSALVVIPCFWHEFLVCVDLGSHTYSAWMAGLASTGKAPGLYIATQKTNVLFDWLLSAMCSYFGYAAGEKIAVALSVLIFFWGTFAFFTSLAGKNRWDVAAPLAMFSYGWVFQTGLFNFYLSIGLALAALAALWSREVRARWLCVGLLPLIMLAHPLGLVVFTAFAVFEFLSKRFQTRGLVIGFLVCIALMAATRSYLASRYWISYSNRPTWMTSGPDQLVLYSNAYFGIAFVALFLMLMLIIEAVDQRWTREPRQKLTLILIATLYLLVKAAILLLPDKVQWSATTAMASFLVNRATLVAAVLLLALMAVLPAHRWKTNLWGAVSLVFFSLLYISTADLSRQQRNAFDTVRILPSFARLTAAGDWQSLLAVENPHLAERACVQHCFVIDNYEIASNQFRLRARSATPLVERSLVQNDRMQAGTYLVRAEDLPLFTLRACPNGRSVCLGKLAAGDRNGYPSIELGTAITSAHP
jgi:hypothetical protein